MKKIKSNKLYAFLIIAIILSVVFTILFLFKKSNENNKNNTDKLKITPIVKNIEKTVYPTKEITVYNMTYALLK